LNARLKMKSLLTITAIFEAATGLALLAFPTLILPMLLGISITEPAGLLVCRIGGAALITLAIACWLAKNEEKSAIALIKALVFYNLAALLLLCYAGGVQHLSGLGLWPAVFLHVALFVWCIMSQRKRVH
jgi:hypothetical protein